MKIILFLIGLLTLILSILVGTLSVVIAHNIMLELLAVLLMITALIGLGFSTLLERMDRRERIDAAARTLARASKN